MAFAHGLYEKSSGLKYKRLFRYSMMIASSVPRLPRRVARVVVAPVPRARLREFPEVDSSFDSAGAAGDADDDEEAE